MLLGGLTTITLAGNTGTIEWQSRTGANAFADLAGETSATLSTGALAVTTDFQAVVTSGTCAPATSTVATVVVNQTSVGGTASGTASPICAGGLTTITLAGNTGTIQWQRS